MFLFEMIDWAHTSEEVGLLEAKYLLAYILQRMDRSEESKYLGLECLLLHCVVVNHLVVEHDTIAALCKDIFTCAYSYFDTFTFDSTEGRKYHFKFVHLPCLISFIPFGPKSGICDDAFNKK